MAVLFNGGIASNGTAVLAPETVEAMLTEHWTYDGSNGNNYYNLFNSWGWGSTRHQHRHGRHRLPGITDVGHRRGVRTDQRLVLRPGY